jgi:hypothetical protein
LRKEADVAIQQTQEQRDADFVKALNGDYGNFNAEYNKDLKLQVYAPSLLVADEDADTSAAMASSDDGDLWEN